MNPGRSNAERNAEDAFYAHTAKIVALVDAVVLSLSDDLRKATYRGSSNRLTGHCYVACEALFHLSGGELEPQFVRHELEPHWFLRDKFGNVVDPTADQFSTPVNYERGRGKGFLTRKPSKRAAILMARATARLDMIGMRWPMRLKT